MLQQLKEIWPGNWIEFDKDRWSKSVGPTEVVVMRSLIGTFWAKWTWHGRYVEARGQDLPSVRAALQKAVAGLREEIEAAERDGL